MNAILEPFKSLWKRKLWPVAVLLVGALVAVPMLLASEPTPAPAPAVAHAKADEGLPATFVASADPAEEGDRRRVLGNPKDPFAPAGLSAKARAARKKVADEQKKADKAAKADTKKDSDKAKSGGSSGGSDTTAPPVSAAPTPAPTYP